MVVNYIFKVLWLSALNQFLNSLQKSLLWNEIMAHIHFKLECRHHQLCPSVTSNKQTGFCCPALLRLTPRPSESDRLLHAHLCPSVPTHHIPVIPSFLESLKYPRWFMLITSPILFPQFPFLGLLCYKNHHGLSICFPGKLLFSFLFQL